MQKHQHLHLILRSIIHLTPIFTPHCSWQVLWILLRHTPQSLWEERIHTTTTDLHYSFSLYSARWRGLDSDTPIDIHTIAAQSCNSLATLLNTPQLLLSNIYQTTLVMIEPHLIDLSSIRTLYRSEIRTPTPTTNRMRIYTPNWSRTHTMPRSLDIRAHASGS